MLPSLRLYDADKSIIVLADEQDTLLVDISLCLSDLRTFSWLREENALVMVIGYLEKIEELDDVRTLSINAFVVACSHPCCVQTDETPTLILRALLLKEQRGLDLNVWNQAIDVYSKQQIQQ